MPDFSTCLVMIVDDTPANIDVLLAALGDSYDVSVAIDGEGALELARQNPPDLILLDVMMPGISGYEVCERLKADARTASIPVVFLTSLSTDQDEARGLELGAVDFVHKPFNPELVKSRVRNHLELKLHRDSLEQLVAEQVEAIAESHMATIFALSKLAESRDDDTGKHLERTQTYCKMLAEELHASEIHPDTIDDEFISTIFYASPLHDIGKVAIPDAILCKPGKLTDDEFSVMKSHTLRGSETIYLVAKRFPQNQFLRMGLDIARWHHEKWDGSGYPDGRSGEEIPLCARIMAVSDVYDALTTKRCYKPAFPHEKAVEIITEGRGGHFDPEVVDAFLRIEHQCRAVRDDLGS